MNNVAGSIGSPQDRNTEARMAVPEEIAASTRHALLEFRAGTDRRFEAIDRRFDGMRDAMERDLRTLFRAITTVARRLAALMAKGFRWF